jgi:pimeloyl-ACP methyl ester carboxylesterase
VLLLIASVFMTSGAFAASRTRQIIRYDSVAIDVIIEGQGPAILLLPSLARDSEDYDAVAEGLAVAGFRVLRPQPRGIGASIGAMTGISLHDFANDVAEVITALGNGRCRRDFNAASRPRAGSPTPAAANSPQSRHGLRL